MKLSKRKQEIEARRASDPLSQLMEREDADYENPDELPTALRIVPGSARTVLRGHDDHSSWAVVAADVESVTDADLPTPTVSNPATFESLAPQELIELPVELRANYRGTPSQLSPNPDPNAPMDEPEGKHCPTCTCG